MASKRTDKECALRSRREKPIKVGTGPVSHRCYIALQMAEVAIPKRLFADILRLISDCGHSPIRLRLLQRGDVMHSRQNQRRGPYE
jgi:hypothetical protein